MLNAARTIWRRHRILSLAFIAALVVTLVFAARLVFFSLYWSDPAHRNRPLEGWMTPRYVAHSYDLPPEVVRSAVGLEPGEARRVTLKEIAEDSGLTMAEIQQRVNEAARAHHGNRP